MKFGDSIDLYLKDMVAEGRISSARTEVAYRACLAALADDVGNRDPRKVGREDIKRTLARWPNPNTGATRRSMLISFFDWYSQEGYRKDNPARQTRPPRRTKTSVYRLNRHEATAFLNAAQTTRERRIAYLGICAGLRNAELRGLQGRHLARQGVVWVSGDIAKGGRERWVPVLDELVPVVDEIRANVAWDEYVIPAQRWHDGWEKTLGQRDLNRKRSSIGPVIATVARIGRRAGISAPVHPHMMRHAFCDHVARYAGLRNAQALMGHATVSTTQGYTGEPTIDELSTAVAGMRFDLEGLPPQAQGVGPAVLEGISNGRSTGDRLVSGVPALSASQALAPVLLRLRAAFLPAVRGETA